VACRAMFAVLWLNGATTYALQVRLLEEQHAAVGRWVNEHTPADAVVASHDIGLLGYWERGGLWTWLDW